MRPTQQLKSIFLATATLLPCLSPAAPPLIVAHRGASADAPENTMAAFNLAWVHGADAIECDVWMTKDKQLVCIHDKSTKKYSHTVVDVTKTSYEKLSSISVAAKHHPKWRNEKAPLLSEVMKTVPAGKKIFIEIKDGPHILDQLKVLLDSSPLSDEQVVIISFNTMVISRAKELFPDIPAMLLQSFKKHKATGTWRPSKKQVLEKLASCGADGLDANASPAYDASLIKMLKTKGLEAHVWTINDPGTAQTYMSYGINSLTTDVPNKIKSAVADYTENNQ